MRTANLGHKEINTHKIAAIRTLLLSEPNIKSKLISYLSIGSFIKVTSFKNGFAKINIDKNHNRLKLNKGYIPEQHLIETHELKLDWVKTAENFIGTPYKWGGKSSFGLDCSALVQLSTLNTDHSLPRDTKDQVKYKEFIDIDLSMAERGDIIFWDGHVGIFINKNFIIHANAFTMNVSVEDVSKVLLRENLRKYKCIKRFKNK
jgi:cell wall-associated NlpC family hydrolase